MLKVNILTLGFKSPNACAFLFPLIIHHEALKKSGYRLEFFTKAADSLTDCDILIIDSKYYSKGWLHHTDQIIDEIGSFRGSGAKVIYADLSDSTGWVHVRMADVIDLYMKNQLLKDRSAYLKPIYSYRYFSEFYHRQNGVNDQVSEFSEPAPNKDFLGKLTVGWNSGLANYSIYGPYKAMIYDKIPMSMLLHYPKALFAPKLKIDRSISCRFGSSYNRETVAYQRKQISSLLESRISSTQKLKRRGYFKEMSQAQLVISPFGLGEITLKDFECFLVGSALFKPDMSHMETWPNLFIKDKTMLTFDWDLENLEERLDQLLDDPETCLEIAQAGQETYLSYIQSASAEEKFVTHFTSIINKLL